MKQLLLIVTVLCSVAALGQNPLKDTKWLGDDGLSIDFGKDTITATMNGQLVAVVVYQVKDSLITIMDVGGEQACPSDLKGIYTYKLSSGTLTFGLKEDPCDGRAQTVNGMLLTKRE